MRKDLVVLVADRDMEQALKGLFGRPEALAIRSIETDILIHPRHDPACARQGVAFLSNLSERYHHGLLMFDHEGSGREQEQATISGTALGQECTKGTGDSDNQLGFGVIDGLLLANVTTAAGSITPEFVDSLIEWSRQVE